MDFADALHLALAGPVVGIATMDQGIQAIGSGGLGIADRRTGRMIPKKDSPQTRCNILEKHDSRYRHGQW